MQAPTGWVARPDSWLICPSQRVRHLTYHDDLSALCYVMSMCRLNRVWVAVVALVSFAVCATSLVAGVEPAVGAVALTLKLSADPSAFVSDPVMLTVATDPSSSAVPIDFALVAATSGTRPGPIGQVPTNANGVATLQWTCPALGLYTFEAEESGGAFSNRVPVWCSRRPQTGEALPGLVIVEGARPAVFDGPTVRRPEGSTMAIAGIAPPVPVIKHELAVVAVTPTSPTKPAVTCMLTSVAPWDWTLQCLDDATVNLSLDVYTASGVGRYPVTVRFTNSNPSIGVLNRQVVLAQSPFTWSIPFTDSGTDDTHVCAIGWDLNASGNALNVAGAILDPDTAEQRCEATTTYQQPGIYRAGVAIVDDDSGAASREIEIEVLEPLSVNIEAAGQIDEGSDLFMLGEINPPTLTFPGPFVTFSWASLFDLLRSDPGSTCTITPPGRLSIHLNCNDDGGVSVMLWATRGAERKFASYPVSVKNVAPEIDEATISAPARVFTGTVVDVTLSFDDPGTNDSQDCTIVWVGPTPSPATKAATVAASPASRRTCSVPTTFATPGTYTGTIAVTDDDGGTDTATRSVAIEVVPGASAAAKVATAPADSTEGRPVTLNANGQWRSWRDRHLRVERHPCWVHDCRRRHRWPDRHLP